MSRHCYETLLSWLLMHFRSRYHQQVEESQRLELITAIFLKIQAFLDVTLCQLVSGSRSLAGMWCLYYFGLLESEDEGINNPLKHQEPLPPRAVSHVRRPETSEQILQNVDILVNRYYHCQSVLIELQSPADQYSVLAVALSQV